MISIIISLKSSIWLIDTTLIGTATPGQSGPDVVYQNQGKAITHLFSLLSRRDRNGCKWERERQRDEEFELLSSAPRWETYSKPYFFVDGRLLGWLLLSKIWPNLNLSESVCWLANLLSLHNILNAHTFSSGS